MDYKEVLYDVSDAVATITLNRPDKLNAWTMRMEGEYKHAMADAEERDRITTGQYVGVDIQRGPRVRVSISVGSDDAPSVV